MTALIVASQYIVKKALDLLEPESPVINSVPGESGSLKSDLEILRCRVKEVAEIAETAEQRFPPMIIEILCAEDEALDYASRRSGRYIESILKTFYRFCWFLGSGKVNKITISKDQIRNFIKKLELYSIKKTTTTPERTLMCNPPSDKQLQKAQLSDRSNVENCLPGLEDDVKKAVSILVNKEQHQTCSIIVICGTQGLGEATIAKRLYNDLQVRCCFDGFAWARVADNFQTRKVLLSIFLQLVPENEHEIINFSTIELVQQLFEVQLSKKFLIVLDDVCDKDAWKCLNLAFPPKKGASKLIVTTRSKQVAKIISDEGNSHTMPTLTEEEEEES